jgi:hydrogenase maturation protease
VSAADPGPAEPRVLVAGIGNVFLGDDAFGVEVVGRIDAGALPDRVDVADYGIGGVHLAYELLDGRYPTLILVDAVPLGEPPGTVAVLEVDPDGIAAPATGLDAHGLDPQTVLAAVRGLGGRLDRVLVVGCQPAAVGECMGLSEPVRAAVDGAVRLVSDLARDEVARIAGLAAAAPGGPPDA